MVDKFLDITVEEEDKVLEKTKENQEFDYLDQKLRMRKDQGINVSKNDYLREIRRILKDEGTKHSNMLEGIYQLQILNMRTFRRKLLSILNGQRSIHRKLTLDLFQIQSSDFFKKDPEYYQLNTQGGGSDMQSSRSRNGRFKKPQARRGFLNMSMISFKTKEMSNDFQEDLNSLICRADKITYETLNNVDDEDNTNVEEVFVIDDKNIHIFYDVASRDLLKLEDEFQRLGTFFIDKFEQSRKFTKAELQQQAILADRLAILSDLYEYEARFQFAKLRLVEEYYEMYEHVTDPLEQYKLIGTIFDMIAQRPLIDFESGYFKESYESEIKTKKKIVKIIRMLKASQMEYEAGENNYFSDVMEKFVEQSDNFEAYLDSLHESTD